MVLQRLLFGTTYAFSLLLVFMSFMQSLNQRFFSGVVCLVAGVVGCWVCSSLLRGRKLLPRQTLMLVGSGLVFLYVYILSFPFLALLGLLSFTLTSTVSSWNPKFNRV